MCATKFMDKAPNESRKIRKPLMEKKRRARINDCLEELKKMLLQNKRESLPEGRPSKLEKADILEQTVYFMRKLIDPVRGYNQGFIESEERTKTMIENYENYENLNLGEKRRLISYLFTDSCKSFLSNKENSNEEIWRPW